MNIYSTDTQIKLHQTEQSVCERHVLLFICEFCVSILYRQYSSLWHHQQHLPDTLCELLFVSDTLVLSLFQTDCFRLCLEKFCFQAKSLDRIQYIFLTKGRSQLSFSSNSTQHDSAVSNIIHFSLSDKRINFHISTHFFMQFITNTTKKKSNIECISYVTRFDVRWVKHSMFSLVISYLIDVHWMIAIALLI